jgi:hypothetical protein
VPLQRNEGKWEFRLDESDDGCARLGVDMDKGRGQTPCSRALDMAEGCYGCKCHVVQQRPKGTHAPTGPASGGRPPTPQGLALCWKCRSGATWTPPSSRPTSARALCGCSSRGACCSWCYPRRWDGLALCLPVLAAGCNWGGTPAASVHTVAVHCFRTQHSSGCQVRLKQRAPRPSPTLFQQTHFPTRCGPTRAWRSAPRQPAPSSCACPWSGRGQDLGRGWGQRAAQAPRACSPCGGTRGAAAAAVSAAVDSADWPRWGPQLRARLPPCSALFARRARWRMGCCSTHGSSQFGRTGTTAGTMTATSCPTCKTIG